MKKLPEITLAFWLMKICATTLGETAGDLFSMTLGIGYGISSVMLLGFFFAVLAWQLRSQKFHPALYWSVILATSTAGTTMSDYMDRTLGLGYMVGSAILIVLLVSVLMLWKFTEKTLSVNNIQSLRGEVFYWTAILFSNTLGTAFGDFLADDTGLGFSGGAMLISGLLIVITIAYYFLSVSRILLFWCAFVLTRPFGATFGDLLTKPIAKGGMNLGTVGSSAVLLCALIVMVVISIYTLNKKGRQTKVR